MLFPGAVKSKFVSELSFVDPSTHPAIPTYRVMDSEGVVVDKNWVLADASEEDVVGWYKNMVTGTVAKAALSFTFESRLAKILSPRKLA